MVELLLWLKSFYVSLALQEFLTDMGTVYLIKENGTEKLPIERMHDYCVTFEGIYYCRDPHDFEERARSGSYIRGKQLRPLKEKLIEFVLDFYSKLDSGDFTIVVKFIEIPILKHTIYKFIFFTENEPLGNFGFVGKLEYLLSCWESEALVSWIRQTTGYYVGSGSVIAGSLIRGMRVCKVKPPYASIDIKTLRGIVNAVYDIVKFRRKSRSKVAVWDHGNIYGVDTTEEWDVVKEILLKHRCE